jgi:hypothetical protein
LSDESLSFNNLTKPLKLGCSIQGFYLDLAPAGFSFTLIGFTVHQPERPTTLGIFGPLACLMLCHATGYIRCYACIQAAVRAFQNIDSPIQNTLPSSQRDFPVGSAHTLSRHYAALSSSPYSRCSPPRIGRATTCRCSGIQCRCPCSGTGNPGDGCGMPGPKAMCGRPAL